MILFEYYSEEKKGMLKYGMTKEEARKIIKSGYIPNKKSEFKNERDYFRTLGIIVHYDDAGKLSELGLVDEYSIFMYKNINLFSNYLKIKSKLTELKVEFISNSEGMEFENKKLNLYAPDLVLDSKDLANEKVNVKAISVDLSKGCSVSFERLISNHIPSKEAYIGSKISSDNGPAIRISYDDQKYFASHGKSKIAKQYREMQKQLVGDGEVMQAIKKDEEDIKSKTSSKYTIALKKMKDYARTLNPKDFTVKNNIIVK